MNKTVFNIKDYPFTKCLNPQKVINPYTNQSLVVPCGKCRACALNKDSRNTFMCNLESLSHKYCMFVTLTFANRFIPRATIYSSYELEDVDLPMRHYLVDKESGEDLGSFDFVPSNIEEIKNKVHLFGDIPYLRKDILQKFLKRLRYECSKINKNEEVRYYAVGEYGPDHFRPHYHLLLWFEDERIYKTISEIISTCWKFGRIDCQVPKGDVAQYVAGYVNSSCYLPDFLRMPSVCPFSCHSRFLGYKIFKSSKEEVYTQTPREYISRCLQLSSGVATFHLPSSVYSIFYPRCKGYAVKSRSARRETYCIYLSARKAYADFGAKTVSQLASFIALDCLKLLNVNYVSDKHSLLARDKVLKFFLFESFDNGFSYKDFEYSEFDDEFDVYFNKLSTRIYSILSTSYRFTMFCCDVPSTYEIERKLNLIDEFYTCLAQMNLSKFYEAQQMFFESDYQEDDLILFYDNASLPFDSKFYDDDGICTLDLKSTKVYSLFKTYVQGRSERSIKHKKLNDLNRIFFDCFLN